MLIGALDIVKETFNLYKNNWRSLLPYLILFFLPSLAISLLGVGAMYLTVTVPTATLVTNLIMLAVVLASTLFSMWVTIALTKALKEAWEKKTIPSWKTTMGTSSLLLWPVILASVATTLIVVGGLILLVIPGIIFAIWYVFAFYEVIFVNKSVGKALKASKRLVVGRWWQILWNLMLPALIFGLILLMVDYLLNVTLLSSLLKDGLLLSVIVSLISSLLNTIFAPLTAGAPLILYLSAKNNPLFVTPPPAEKKA